MDDIDYFIKNKNSFLLSDDLFPNTSNSDKFSLVIPTAGRAPFRDIQKNPLYWALTSVIESRLIPDEIIIIDNTKKSTEDYSKDVVNKVCLKLNEKEKKCCLKYEKVNIGGSAEAKNYGIKLAQNEIIHLLDDDCVLHKEAFFYGIKVLMYLKDRRNDLYGNIALFCMPQNKRATIPTKFKSVDGLSKLDLVNFHFTGSVSSTFPKEYLPKNKKFILNNPIFLENYQGGNIFLFKSKILEVGGFPEYKGPITYGEETGLSLKLKKRNYKIIYYPFLNLQAVHLSYGNPNPPRELLGDKWIFEDGKLNLERMVEESLMEKFDTGARVENYIYFYTKIKNFATIIKDCYPMYIDAWFVYVLKFFVEENSLDFLDGKGRIDSFESRKKIYNLSFDDFRNNRVKTKDELRKLLKTDN